jgi:hypothetical protein
MSQQDNSLPKLTHISFLKEAHMWYQSCYYLYLGLLHRRYRGHQHQMMKLEINESEEPPWLNLIESGALRDG